MRLQRLQTCGRYLERGRLKGARAFAEYARPGGPGRIISCGQIRDGHRALLCPSAAAKLLGVTTQTLRVWAKNGRIKCSFTPGGDARYHLGNISHVSCGLTPATAPKQVSVIYARVSSSKQKADLQRQIDFLRAKFPGHEVVSDIASGVNLGRKGLVALLDRCLAGSVKEVVVAHRDRLARIGFELLEHIIARSGSVLTVYQDPSCKDCFEELGDDLMAIVTHFAAKHHGRRKYT